MQFYPKNKFILVEPYTENVTEQKNSNFLLPEDYKKVETYKLMKIVKASGGSEYSLSSLKDKLILVPSQMVEEIKVMGTTMYLVPEHCICGIFLE